MTAIGDCATARQFVRCWGIDCLQADARGRLPALAALHRPAPSRCGGASTPMPRACLAMQRARTLLREGVIIAGVGARQQAIMPAAGCNGRMSSPAMPRNQPAARLREPRPMAATGTRSTTGTTAPLPGAHAGSQALLCAQQFAMR